MNLAFYANGPKSGLDCNGGSRTVVKSAETLRKLGHRVDIVAHYDAYSWDKHPRVISSVPEDTDVVVAVCARDVKNACKTGHRAVWWMRGWETWMMSEIGLLTRANMCPVICNSSWLVDKLAGRGIKAELCFAGLDLDVWGDDGLRNDGRKPVVGGYRYDRHKTKRYDLYLRLRDRFDDFGEGDGELDFATTVDITGNQDSATLCRNYNICNMMFLPTELEGFSNVGAEANLCGCLVVCNRLPSNGMGDYATDETAMRYDTFEEAVECVKRPAYGKIPKMQAILREKIGSREKNMKRFVELCQNL